MDAVHHHTAALREVSLILNCSLVLLRQTPVTTSLSFLVWESSALTLHIQCVSESYLSVPSPESMMHLNPATLLALWLPSLHRFCSHIYFPGQPK